MFRKKPPAYTPPSHRLAPANRLCLEADFLGRVYDEFDRTRDADGVVDREFRVEDRDHPRWWWLLHGDRDRWCLEIRDHTIPELVGKPYYLDPVGDPSFFDYAWLPKSTDANMRVSKEDLSYFMGGIGTAMDEHLLGQSEALKAYKLVPDVIPWVHTNGPP